MIVPRTEWSSTIKKLATNKKLAIDTETTGLRLWHSDKVFSVIFAGHEGEYYFDLRDGTPDFQELFNDDSLILYMANAKFDLAGLYSLGFTVNCDVRDIQVQARIIRNDYMKYSLSECAKRMGLQKSEAVEEYITENGLWEWNDVPGEKRTKNKFYSKVPLDVIVPYAENDARITYQLGCYYDDVIETASKETPNNLPTLLTVALNEYRFTKTCFEMEKIGISIDRRFCEESYDFEKKRAADAIREFEKIYGGPFVDSYKSLAKAFAPFGQTGNRTAKGNPSFTEEALRSISGPGSALAKCVLEYRESSKKATTYYQNFLYQADADGKIHSNIRQAGTATGRISVTEPALQTIPKEDDSKYKVKDAFVPSPDYFFVEFDYKAFEYRVMLEYSGEKELAELVNGGMDVHIATAQMIGVDRKTAKTINFACLYGAGRQKIADSLKISIEQAQSFKNTYFAKLPKVYRFLYEVQTKAKERGFIFNWLGRRCYFSDSQYAYKAPNALIQGSCADIVKLAMNRCADYLKDKKSRMLLQVHDSVLFEVHNTEKHVISELKNILESAYKSNLVKIEVDCKYSLKSWGSMVDYKGEITL